MASPSVTLEEKDCSGEWSRGLVTGSDSAGLGWDLSLCISEELTGKAAAAGSRTMLEVVLHYLVLSSLQPRG